MRPITIDKCAVALSLLLACACSTASPDPGNPSGDGSDTTDPKDYPLVTYRTGSDDDLLRVQLVLDTGSLLVMSGPNGSLASNRKDIEPTELDHGRAVFGPSQIELVTALNAQQSSTVPVSDAGLGEPEEGDAGVDELDPANGPDAGGGSGNNEYTALFIGLPSPQTDLQINLPVPSGPGAEAVEQMVSYLEELAAKYSP